MLLDDHILLFQDNLDEDDEWRLEEDEWGFKE